MKKYTNFLNEYNDNKLRFSAFDWDDNILHMPTKIHLQRMSTNGLVNISMTTAMFAKNRSKITDNPKVGEYILNEHSFDDFGNRQKFVNETKIALTRNMFGPAFNNFIKSLVNGELFAIITARTVDADILKNAVEIIVYEYLTDEQQNQMIQNLLRYSDLFGTNPDSVIEYYLEKCDYYPVSSAAFISKYGENSDVSNPEEGKKKALEMFAKRIEKYGKLVNKTVSLGFSDDDISNVNSITKHFNEIKDFYDINFSVFDTSNPNISGGKKIKIK